MSAGFRASTAACLFGIDAVRGQLTLTHAALASGNKARVCEKNNNKHLPSKAWLFGGGREPPTREDHNVLVHECQRGNTP